MNTSIFVDADNDSDILSLPASGMGAQVTLGDCPQSSDLEIKGTFLISCEVEDGDDEFQDPGEPEIIDMHHY